MNDDEIAIGGKYIFLDWYRQKLGEFEPLVEVEITEVRPNHHVDGLNWATSYTMVDNEGIKHYGSSNSLRPLDWIDDRAITAAYYTEMANAQEKYQLKLDAINEEYQREVAAVMKRKIPE